MLINGVSLNVIKLTRKYELQMDKSETNIDCTCFTFNFILVTNKPRILISELLLGV